MEQNRGNNRVRGIFIPDFISDDKTLTSGAKTIYGRLYKLSWKYGYAFPGLDYLAEMQGLSVRQVIRLINELKNAGVVTVKRTGRANHYYLTSQEEVEALRKNARQNESIGEARSGISDRQNNDDRHIICEEDFTADMTSAATPYKKENLRKESNIVEPHKNEAPPVESSPPKNTNKKSTEFIQWFIFEYRRLTGNNYKPTQPKDNVLVNKLLDIYGEDKLKDMALKMLEGKDQWAVQAGLTIGILSARANGWALQTRGRGADEEKIPGFRV